MRNILLFIALFGFSLSTQAQVNDPVAKNILDAVSKKYNQIKSYTTDFILIIENPDAGIKESQAGRLWVKGDMYRLLSDELERMTDGATIWTHFIADEEVHVSEPDPEDEELTPARIFDIYKEGFIYQYVGELEVDGLVCNIVDLTPIDKEKSYYRIRLMIDKTTSSIHQAQASSKNGTKFTYELSNFDSKSSPKSDDYFVFNRDEYDGDLDIIDLR